MNERNNSTVYQRNNSRHTGLVYTVRRRFKRNTRNCKRVSYNRDVVFVREPIIESIPKHKWGLIDYIRTRLRSRVDDGDEFVGYTQPLFPFFS